jgi:type II secretory pathway pseudopilin PulG
MNTESTNSMTSKVGFTLLQLLMVFSIIAILVAVMIPITGAMRKRAEKVKCMSNLKTLSVALNDYVSENRKWPQVPSKAMEKPETMWKWWMETFEVAPYNIPRKTWVCPTVLAKSGITEDKDITLGSYATTRFDGSSANRPYQWNQPWLVEIGNHHGSGQLYLMPDGSIRSI